MVMSRSVLDQFRVVRHDPILPEGWNALREAILGLYDEVSELAARAPASLFVAVRDAVTGDFVPTAWIAAVAATPIANPEAPLPPGVRVGDRYLIVNPEPGAYAVTVEPRPSTGYAPATAEVTVIAGEPASLDVLLVRARDQRTLPNLFGVGFAAARDQLVALGLAIGRVLDAQGHVLAAEDWPRFEDQPVIATQPGSAMTVPVGQAVDLLLAATPFPRFPQLVGLLLPAAQDALNAFVQTYSLTLANVEVAEEASDEPPGTVIAQVPLPDAEIFTSSLRVRLVIAVAPTVTVPDLMGMTMDDAAAALAQAGLALDVTIAEQPTTSAEDDGRVAAQEPPAGASLPPGSPVRLTVWRLSLVTVPNLIGMPLDAAAAALAEAGLTLDEPVAEQPTTAAENDGRVAAQEPPAGASLPPGSPVRLTVWRLSLVTVPNLIGMTLANAQQMLLALGLRALTTTRVVSDPAQVDSIVSQAPIAGTRVAPGSLVTLAVGTLALMPELRCLPLPDAEERLRKFVDEVGVEWDGQLRIDAWPSPRARDSVIGQTPLAGASVGPRLVEAALLVRRPPFPDVRFLHMGEHAVDERLKIWADANGVPLLDIRVRTAPSDRAPDTVLAQRPTALSTEYSPEGFVADLVLAERRPEPLRGLPELTGLDRERAARVLREFQQQFSVNLRVVTVDAASERPEGTILAQEPRPGTTMEPGAQVTLTIARPPLPDVICLNIDEAHALIERAAEGRALRWSEERQPSDLPEGQVIGQDPPPGAPIPEVEQVIMVTVSVSAGSLTPRALISLAIHRVRGIGKVRARQLRAASIADAATLAHASVEEVARALDVAPGKLARSLIQQAQRALVQAGPTKKRSAPGTPPAAN